MNEKQPFLFQLAEYNTSEVFYARLRPDLHKVDHLFEDLYYLLWFPGYFGFNWNALQDCLTDLEWISENKVVLVHADIPQMSEANLIIYINILRRAVSIWQDRKAEEEYEMVLEIVFPENCRLRIEELLLKANQRG